MSLNKDDCVPGFQNAQSLAVRMFTFWLDLQHLEADQEKMRQGSQ